MVNVSHVLLNDHFVYLKLIPTQPDKQYWWVKNARLKIYQCENSFTYLQTIGNKSCHAFILLIIQNKAAHHATLACLMVRRIKYLKVGNF